MALDPEFLSRLQFAWVVGWHILLPAFTVGLASFIAFLEGAYALTKRPVFLDLSRFWLRIFAISFGMGVVTGIVMPFQSAQTGAVFPISLAMSYPRCWRMRV
jgi:cytochrome bd ubiquinol oxidase subunit I